MSGPHASTRKIHPLEARLRAAALAYPEAHEDFPWGDRVVKVKKKVFVFMGVSEAGRFGCSLKLPQSGMLALDLPFASPTGYGLGKSGWVSFESGGSEEPDLEMLLEWLRESYLAVAPKTLSKTLDAPSPKAEPKSKAKPKAVAKPKTLAKPKAKAAPKAKTKKARAR